MKILIIGGYGAFGSRLAELLAENKELQLFIGGRTLHKAEQLCARLSGHGANFTPVKIDKFNLPPALSRYNPEIVVDASGPFNLNSENSYSVVKACIEAGVHYLDLADGADFVMGISQFDAAARKKNLTVISGLSTCPAITGAVLREAKKDMAIESVEIGVAPSPFARMGLSVVEGIFDYTGEKIKAQLDGQQTQLLALGNRRSKTIAPPGALPLDHRFFAFVDCPDLQIIPATDPNNKNVWVGAGTRPQILLRVLMCMSIARSILKLPKFNFLSKLGHKLLNGLSSGEHRGGLYLIAKNENETREWHILAEGDDGPFIPSMACAALINKWTNTPPESGARPADQTLRLEDLEPYFISRDITYGWRHNKNSIHEFENILSSFFNDLPEHVRVLHAPNGATVWTGKAKTVGPSNILGRLAGLVAGVNVKTGETDVTVSITPTQKGEVWVRDFGGRKFKSRLKAGTDKTEYLMMEQFGPLKFALALVVKDDRLYFIPRRWFFLGLPMPNLLLPRGETYETVTDEKFEFNVDLQVPIIGRIAKYQGWLEQEN